MEDETIVALFWQKDAQAIPAAEEKYGGFCRGLAQKLLDSPEDAEECVNDTLHRLWETIPPQRPGSLRAYMAKIVRNLCIDRWRQRTARRRGGNLTFLSLELEDCLPAAPSAEELTEGREVAACISRWLEGLPREDRVLFVRRYWYGDTVEELAARRGVPGNRLAQKLRRMRGSLRRALEKEGISV